VPSEVANKDAKSHTSTDRVEKSVVRENSLRYREMQAPNDATDSSPVGLGPGHHEATEQAITGSSEPSLPGDIPPRNNGDGVSHSLLDQADHLSEHEKLYDTLFTRLRKALLTDFDTKSDSDRQQYDLREEFGLLWRGDRLYIPKVDNLRQDVLHWHHDVPWMCHLGIENTLEMVAHQFYWPCMDQDIKQYIASCIQCQTNKSDRIRRLPPRSPLVAPSSCWRTLGVDRIVDLPESEEAYNAVCVFVCHLSKMVRLLATRTTLTAAGFAQLFMKEKIPH
jgi:hypothetical protein